MGLDRGRRGLGDWGFRGLGVSAIRLLGFDSVRVTRIVRRADEGRV